ncbi:hypothetical protein B484DRAFT_390735, partial [Ochromonadaceae sp. CCMP2298]
SASAPAPVSLLQLQACWLTLTVFERQVHRKLAVSYSASVAAYYAKAAAGPGAGASDGGGGGLGAVHKALACYARAAGEIGVLAGVTHHAHEW